MFNQKVLKDIVNGINSQKNDMIVPLQKELESVTRQIKDLEFRKNRIFELYEEGTIDKQTLSNRLEKMSNEVGVLSVRKIEIEKELENNNIQDIPYEIIKDTLSNFHSLLEMADLEDKKTLLQIIISKITIKDKKDINSIELYFNENIRKYFITNKREEPSHVEGSSFYTFKIAI